MIGAVLLTSRWRSMSGHGSLLPSARWTTAVLAAFVAFMATSLAEEMGKLQPLTYHVQPASSAISLDGKLDESAWRDALSLELDYEVRPGENTAPPVRTVVMVTHDEQSIYFGFRAYDPEPSKIRARYSNRDEAWDDDWVGVVLDTFNDERRAYEFLSNPLGVKMDALNDDVLGDYDKAWNAFWGSEGRITQEGYEVEMAIPFHQVRFQDSNGDPQTWGFDAIRSYPRSDRHQIGLFPRDRGNNSYLSQAVKLEGMEGANPGQNFELLPTLIASRADQRISESEHETNNSHADLALGATLRWGITPSVTLTGAINPDFSQVEADVLRLGTNEQFALFFPETRPFFLEGSDYFNTPLHLVHTRAIVDPLFAGKVTGKQGRSTYGFFSARDEITTMLFPGPEGSNSDSFDLETTDTVGRYRVDFGRNSTVGATFTDRRGGGYFSQLASIDTTARFTKVDRIRASFSASRTRYSEEMLVGQQLPAGTFQDEAMEFDYLHSVHNWWTSVTYNDIGDGFRADLGFMPQVGFREWRLSGARLWWGAEGAFHRRLSWGGMARYQERQNGELLEQSTETSLELHGPRESFAQFIISTRDESFNGVRFENELYAHTLFEIQAVDDLKLRFHFDCGDWVDHTLVLPARRILIQPRLRYNIGRHALVAFEHTYETSDVDRGRLFRVHAPEGRFVYQFNGRAFVRGVVQYTDVKRSTSLYDGEVEPRTRNLSSQFLFAYGVSPRSVIYVGYSGDHAVTGEYERTQESRSLFIKLAYAWVR
jgi:hypothetical protein